MKMSRREVLITGAAAAVAAVGTVTGTTSALGVEKQSGNSGSGRLSKSTKHFDILIVGGGSAGAVLATRLSDGAGYLNVDPLGHLCRDGAINQITRRSDRRFSVRR